jgi:cell fate regulator YaaT (PSP1 superfamily)
VAELYLVEFKGSRKEYFYNSYHHALKLSEAVIVQAEQGEEMGVLIKRIEGRSGAESGRPRSILRPAGKDDRLRFADLKQKEAGCKREIVPLIRKHGLTMKVVDVECQFDGNKITFYFTADHRVDFRSLVRDLASRYRTRIELRQIGVRDEARRNDGYGICGRRQCCNTHLKDFAPISTAHAREQELSLNPSKISGNCGRLLCCLRYEVDSYAEVKRRFPAVGSTVETKSGSGVILRIDYFREEMVLQDAEGTESRAGIKDLVTILKTPDGRAAAKPLVDYVEETTSSADEREALKRLDEPENLN